MIPLITHTPRLLLLAGSRALLTAELHKPQYFPVLLGADMPLHWPPPGHDHPAMRTALELLTAGGRTAAGWYGWYALHKATAELPRTLIGTGSFLGPPDAAGTAEVRVAVVTGWRGQGLGRELLAGLVQQAAATGMVQRLVAHIATDNTAAQRTALANGFEWTDTAPDGRQRFERAVVPALPVL